MLRDQSRELHIEKSTRHSPEQSTPHSTILMEVQRGTVGRALTWQMFVQVWPLASHRILTPDLQACSLGIFPSLAFEGTRPAYGASKWLSMQILTSQHMMLMLGEGTAIGRLEQEPMSTSSGLTFHSSPPAETSQEGEEMLANADISNTAPLRKVCPKNSPSEHTIHRS